MDGKKLRRHCREIAPKCSKNGINKSEKVMSQPDILSAHEQADDDNEKRSHSSIVSSVPVPSSKTGDAARCCVCHGNDLSKKYRCPKCRSPYCSLNCFKEHKAICANVTQLIKNDTSQTPLEIASRKRSRQEEDEIDLLVCCYA